MFMDTFSRTKRMEQLRTVIKRGQNYYFVSTNDTFDHGLETMVFPCSENGEVSDYGELAVDRYDTVNEAKEGHLRMVAGFQP